MNISDKFAERYIIPVLLLSREDDLWWCLSFEEMLRESCTEKNDSWVTKKLGKMDMVVGTSYSSEIMWIYGANPIATPTIEMNSME